MDHSRHHQLTLAWVNHIRTTLGKSAVTSLPAGIPGDDYPHPVCQALPCGADLGSGTLLLARYEEVARPDAVADLCDRFDDWHYPDLIDSAIVSETLTSTSSDSSTTFD